MQKIDFKKNPIFRIISLFSGERSSILSIVIYSMTSGILLLSIPIAVQALVNTIARGGLQQQLIVLSTILLIVMVMIAVLILIQIYIAEKLRRRLAVRIAFTLSHIIPKEKYLASMSVADPKYINRFMEVFSVQKVAGTLLLDGSLTAFQVIFGLILMAFYHPMLLIFSVILACALYLIISIIGHSGVDTAINESSAKYNVLSWLEDIAAYPVTFKASESDKFIISKTDELLVNYVEKREKHFKVIFSQQFVTLFLQALISALLLALGGYLVINNELSLGQLVAAELILGVILSGMNKLIKYVQEYYSLVASVDKLDFLIECEVEDTQTGEIEKLPSAAKLEFRDVTLHHNHKPLSLKSLTINPGDKVVLYGENNSGKSSFTDSLYGLCPHLSGSIRLDNRNIEDMPVNQLRSEVILVRGIEIFQGTIEENIRLGHKNISQSEMRNITTNLKIYDEINSFPQKFKTVIDPKFISNISKSVAIKIMIARGLVAKPRLMILDEIIDGFDAEEKADVLNFLNSDKSFTLVTTTHEDTSFLKADIFVEIDKENMTIRVKE